MPELTVTPYVEPQPAPVRRVPKGRIATGAAAVVVSGILLATSVGAIDTTPTPIPPGTEETFTCVTEFLGEFTPQEATLLCAATASPAPTSPPASVSPAASPTASTTASATVVPTAPSLSPSASPSPAPTASPTATPASTPSPSTPPSEPNPLSCAGYLEPRIFLEAQSWWDPVATLGGLGHVHLGMCFPVGQTVSGVVHFDARILLHHNAGTWTRFKMQDDKSTDHIVMRPNLAVSPGADEQAFWVPIEFDTTKMPDGIRHWRWYADVEHPNGNSQTARPVWSLRVENGKPDQNASVRFMGSGWYREADPPRDFGYVFAQLNAPPPTGPVARGSSLGVKCINNGTSQSPDVTEFTAHWDPDFHEGFEGTILAIGSGEGSYTVTIPTNATPGLHQLVLRCAQTTDDASESFVQNAGVLRIPIRVAP